MKPSTKKIIRSVKHDYVEYTSVMLKAELERRIMVKDYTLNGVKRSKVVVKTVFEMLIKDKKEKE